MTKKKNSQRGRTDRHVPSLKNNHPPRLTIRRLIIVLIMQLIMVRSAFPRQENNAVENNNDVIKVIASEVSETEAIYRSTTFVDIIPTENAYKSVESVSETLSERVGVQTKRFGGLGSQSSVSIRGSNPNQVVIYLDGMPLNDAKFGEVNLENLPIDNLERIEVYRSFTPVRFAVSGIGGVVNLVTKKTKDYSSNILSASYGSFNTSKVTASRSQKIKAFDYLLFFNRTGSDGDFEFIDDNGTPQNDADDRRVKRKNNDHQSYNATLKGGYSGDRCRVSVMNDFFYKDQGLPGIYSNDITSIRFETLRNIINVGFTTTGLIHKNINTDAKLYYSLRQDDFNNSRGEDIGLGGAMRQKGYFNSVGTDLVWELILPKAYQYLTLLTSYEYESYKNRENSYYTADENRWSPLQHRHRFTLALEDEISLVRDRLRIIPQFRYEYWNQRFMTEDAVFGNSDIELGAEDESHHIGGQLGLKYYPFDDHLYLKANAGRGFRAPTFTELFGDRGYVLGNPHLKPERSINVDAGIGYDYNNKISILDRIFVEYAFFYIIVEDHIIFLHNSQFTMKAQNIDKAEIMGHELSLSLGLFEHLMVSCNYTYQQAIDKGKIPYYRNKYLPHRPIHEASLSVTARGANLSCRYELSYTGANFRDRYNSAEVYVYERLIHNMQITLTPYSGINLVLEIKNVDDNMVEDLLGYPLPGISCYGTVSASFSDDGLKP